VQTLWEKECLLKEKQTGQRMRHFIVLFLCLPTKKREPWRPGGTTFYFTHYDIFSVLEKAKKDAGNKDVRISGGADVIQQYLNAGLVDEFSIHLAPIMMGSGVRLFNNINKEKFPVELSEGVSSQMVTHLFYKVKN